MNLIITVAADGLAPNGARPSAATVLKVFFMLRHISCKICFASYHYWLSASIDIIINDF